MIKKFKIFKENNNDILNWNWFNNREIKEYLDKVFSDFLYPTDGIIKAKSEMISYGTGTGIYWLEIPKEIYDEDIFENYYNMANQVIIDLKKTIIDKDDIIKVRIERKEDRIPSYSPSNKRKYYGGFPF